MKAYLVFILSWFVPGLGHLMQKRVLKGIIFFSGILILVCLGLFMEGKLYSHKVVHPLLLLGFLGDLGTGIFFVLIKAFGNDLGNIRSVTFHYGTTYIACAGLLNYLIALNAFDIAKGRKT